MTKGQVLGRQLDGHGPPARGVDLRRISKLLSPRHDHHDPQSRYRLARIRLRTARPSQVCPHSAGSLGRSANRRLERSNSRSGCQPRDGTGKFAGADNGGFGGRSITAKWAMRSVMTMPRPPPTRVTRRVRWVCWTRVGPWGNPEKVIDYGYRAIHETAADGPGHCGRVLWARSQPLVFQWLFRTADGRR